MGKSKGKMFLSVVGFAVGFANPAMFGLSKAATLMGGLYGASLGSSIWSAMHPVKQTNTSTFDQYLNATSSEAVIPVVYGCRKVGGIQSYHYSHSQNKNLVKDVILSEGQISGAYGVTANNKLISSATIFSIKNELYSDAKVSIVETDSPTGNDKELRLYTNGSTTTISLQGGSDLKTDGSNDFSCNISKLIQYLTEYGYTNGIKSNGWVIDNVVHIDGDPEKIPSLGVTACYNNFVDIKGAGLKDCSYTLYDGASGQAPPNNYTKVGGYKNMAYIRANLKISDDLQGGNPTITAILKGLQIWDTRTGVYGYSENSAMCIRDYLLSKRYGLGKWITQDMLDEDSFKEEADYCDELVSYKDVDRVIKQEKRYTLNIALNERKNAIEQLQDMLASFGGFLVFSNGRISLRTERPTTVSYSFSDAPNIDNIVRDSVSFTQTSLDDTPNKYIIKYTDPQQNWSTVTVLVEDTVAQEEQGKIIPKDVFLKGCTRQTQAKRAGNLYKNLNKVCSMNIQFSTGTFAMHLQPGDVINVTYRNYFADKPFRILEIQEQKGTWTIRGREYNESVYDDDYIAEIEIKDYTTVPNALSDIIPTVSNIVVDEVYYKQRSGEIINYLNVTCDIPDYIFFKSAIVEYSEDEITWLQAGVMQNGKAIINGVKTNATYFVRIKVENTLGRFSDYEATNGYYTVGKNVPPGNVQNLTCTETTGGFILTWTPNTDNDIDGYVIYKGIGDSGIDSSVKIADKIYSNTFFVPISNSGDYIFYVFAVDTSGNQSEVPGMASGILKLPDVPRSFNVVKNGNNLDFKWGSSGSNLRYELRRGPTWSTGDRICITFDTSHTLFFPVAGSHVFWIKSLNDYGNYSAEASFVDITVFAPQDRNIITTLDQVALGWQGNKLNTHVDSFGRLVLDSNAINGEYVVEVNLPQKLSARNWILTQAVSVAGDEMTWGSANFTWEDVKSNTSWEQDGNLVDGIVKHQISKQTSIPDNIIESFGLNSTLIGEKNSIAPVENIGATYQYARFRQGVFIRDDTKISWNIDVPQTFSTVFYVKIIEPISFNVVYLVLSDTGSWLRIGFDIDKGVFYLEDHLLRRNEVSISYSASLDYISFGVSQTATERKFYVKSFSMGTVGSSVQPFESVGPFTNMRLYP